MGVSVESEVRSQRSTILLVGYPVAGLLFSAASLGVSIRSTTGPFGSLGFVLALYGIGLSLFMLGFSVMESRRGNANQVTIFEMFFCAALLIGFVTLFIDLFSNATLGSPGDLIVIFLSVGYLLVSVYWVVIMAIRTAQAGLWSS